MNDKPKIGFKIRWVSTYYPELKIGYELLKDPAAYDRHTTFGYMYKSIEPMFMIRKRKDTGCYELWNLNDGQSIGGFYKKRDAEEYYE